ncbi:MAG: hypothetical protein AB7I18_03015 [Candidatus Berkiella sp.]
MRNDVFSFFGHYRFKNGKMSKNRICLSSLAEQQKEAEMGDYGIIFSTINHGHDAANENSVAKLSNRVNKLARYESLNIIQLFQGDIHYCVNNMTLRDLHKLIDDFASATRAAFEGGFDGAEILGSHEYFLAQFFSPLLNSRQDEFGGSVLNRANLACRILKACRQVVPHEFLLGFRLTPEHPQLGLDIDDSLQIADLLVQAGADFIDLSLPNLLLASKKYLHLSDKPILAYFREQLGNHYPLIVAGNLQAPIEAQKAFESGASFVAVAAELRAGPV